MSVQKELTLAELVATEFVRCTHCCQLYNQPVLLPCLHTLCQECVIDIILSDRTAADHQSTGQTSQSHSSTQVRHNTPNSSAPQRVQPQSSAKAKGNRVTQDIHTLPLRTEKNVQLVCPVCQSDVTLTGNTATTTEDQDDTRTDKYQRHTINRIQQKPDPKAEHQSGAGTQKPDQGLAAEKRVRILVRKIVQASLCPNYFLQSLAQLHRYKNQPAKDCAYCKNDGEVVEASSLCLECQDEMCEDCARAHRKTKLTREHTVAPYTSLHQGLYDHDVRSHDSVPCTEHPASPVTHYCYQCQLTICKTCRTGAHNEHDTAHVNKASSKLFSDIQQVQQAISRRVPSLSQYVHFLDEQISRLDTRTSLVVSEINSQVDLVHKMIEDYRQQAISRMEQACEEEKFNVTQKRQDITTAATSLQQISDFLLHLANIGRQDELLSLYGQVMDRHRQLVNSQPNALVTALSSAFTPGPSTQQNVHILVGMLDIRHMPLGREDTPQSRLAVSSLMPTVLCPPQVQLIFQAESTSDTNPVYPSGLAINKTLLAVVDRENAKVKIYDHGGKFLKEFSGEGQNKLVAPFDAIFLENGAIAVTDSEAGCVRVFDWTGKFLTNFTGEIRHPRGITQNLNGEVVVLDGHLRHLTVHQAATGKMVRKIRPRQGDSNRNVGNAANSDDFTSDVLIDPHYVAVTSQDYLVITDMASPNLKIINKEGIVLATSMDYGTRQDESLHPSGLCVDRFGQILVADTNNSRIHLGLPNGQMPATLVTEGDGISKPVSLTVDNEGHLVLAQSGGEIRLLKYL